ncbi:MAG: recombinase family protein [Glycocaulis sp.]
MTGQRHGSSPVRTIRCAIYTRKSSEEGLEQEFNSLDAQREACEAYVASQRHEGWKLLDRRYDDGGLSGGTLERPALQTLLGDIEAGRVDLVVVYKVDRLTRSLADFARLVDRMDGAGCSFVSVTQAFNTATSMGRLTLNVLLSFAQFEREVTAERIRDKIAASKARGLWMGGICPIGYAPDGRTLRIIEPLATTVRTVFALYDRLGCLRQVQDEAERLGLELQTRPSRKVMPEDQSVDEGRAPRGISRGRIHQILTNPVYAGRIRHKDKVHEGQHPAIIDPELWQSVQVRLKRGSKRARDRAGAKVKSPLVGRVFDESGERLTPCHANRGSRRYRYYVSAALITRSGEADAQGVRLPAEALEQAVASAVRSHLAENRCALLDGVNANAAELVRTTENLSSLGKADTPACLSLVKKVTLLGDRLDIQLDSRQLAERAGLEAAHIPARLLTFEAPYTRRRRGVETRFVVGERSRAPDPLMRETLAKAIGWAEALKGGTPLHVLAERENTHPRHIRNRIQMAFLSPAIMQAICEGAQPAHLSTETFVRTDIPLCWDEQARVFGFVFPKT